MNERINNLVKQATEKQHNDFNVSTEQVNIQVFTDLLIQDIFSIITNVRNDARSDLTSDAEEDLRYAITNLYGLKK